MDLYVTHLIGEYCEGINDGYRSHRVLQAAECAAYINLTAREGSIVCLAGDLNSLPKSPELTVLRTLAALSDCFEECHGDSPELGHTFAAEPNPYSWKREPGFLLRTIPGLNGTIFNFEHSKRVDFILSRGPVQIESCEVAFNHEAGSSKVYVSDHFGVSTELKLKAGSSLGSIPTSKEIQAAKECLQLHASRAAAEAEYYQWKHFAWAVWCVFLGAVSLWYQCSAQWATALALFTVVIFHQGLYVLMKQTTRSESRTLILVLSHILLLLLVYAVAIYQLGMMEFIGCLALGMTPAFVSTHFLIGFHFCGELRNAIPMVLESVAGPFDQH